MSYLRRLSAVRTSPLKLVLPLADTFYPEARHHHCHATAEDWSYPVAHLTGKKDFTGQDIMMM